MLRKFTPIFLSLTLAFYIVLNRVDSLNKKKSNIYQLKVGQSSLEVENKIGGPDSKVDGDWFYYFNSNTVLKLSFYKKKLFSAELRYNKKPHFKEHTFPANKFVKLQVSRTPSSNNTIIVALPEKGIVWEITSKGTIKKISWQGAFEFANEKKSLETIIGEIQGHKTAQY